MYILIYIYIYYSYSYLDAQLPQISSYQCRSPLIPNLDGRETTLDGIGKSLHLTHFKRPQVVQCRATVVNWLYIHRVKPTGWSYVILTTL